MRGLTVGGAEHREGLCCAPDDVADQAQCDCEEHASRLDDEDTGHVHQSELRTDGQ